MPDLNSDDFRHKCMDLRGTACPTNYVKAKLQLEFMELGDILEILVDEGEPSEHVPKSLERDGQEILAIHSETEGVRITIKKQTNA